MYTAAQYTMFTDNTEPSVNTNSYYFYTCIKIASNLLLFSLVRLSQINLKYLLDLKTTKTASWFSFHQRKKGFVQILMSFNTP